MKRRGIAYALIMVFGVILLIGIIYGTLYFGPMTSIQNQAVADVGTGAFDQPSMVFFETVGLFFMFIMTLALLLWLWQQSQKRNLAAF